VYYHLEVENYRIYRHHCPMVGELMSETENDHEK
jgi:hypothetical protein